MQTFRAVLIIGIMEILIGSITIFGNLFVILLNMNNKSPNVLLFVLITAAMSILIGIGILKFNNSAYNLLIYFSSVIILTKFLMFFGIIQLNGELELSVHRAINIPATEFLKNTMNILKNVISIGYHGLVIHFLSQSHVKSIFHRN